MAKTTKKSDKIRAAKNNRGDFLSILYAVLSSISLTQSPNSPKGWFSLLFPFFQERKLQLREVEALAPNHMPGKCESWTSYPGHPDLRRLSCWAALPPAQHTPASGRG